MGISYDKEQAVRKDQRRKNSIPVILLLELLLVCAYVWTLSSKGKADLFIGGNEIYADAGDQEIYTNILKPEAGAASWKLKTAGITLDQGIYDICVRYKAAGNGTVEAFGNLRNTQSMWSDAVRYIPEKEEISFQVWINEKTEGFGISVWSDGEEVQVNEIRIRTAWNSVLYLTLVMILKILLANMVLFLVIFRKELQKYSVQICGILGITVICSVGLFTRYLTFGHDMVFHMNRIEGLKDGLLSGAFPVRIQPTWNHGWGYAVSVMYGDVTLALPALMRIAGFTLQTTWKTFILVINLLTAMISFYSFHKICKDKYLALFASLLYCTGMYRLACIYIRAAVGEFTVMMFLPLVVLGFWYALGEEESERYGEQIAAPVIGFTGMIQTHVLTCEMSAFFILALCLIMVKKVIRKKTFFYLVRIVIWTVLVNLWFLVPFLSFLGEEFAISQMGEMRDDFQTWGLSFAELFATSPARAYGFTFGENVSLANKCTFSLGTSLWVGAAAGLVFLWGGKVKKPKAPAIVLSFGGAASWMATNRFPYQQMKEFVPYFAAVFSKIQFSYRFLGLAGLFFTLAVLFVAAGIGEREIKRTLAAGMVALSVLAVYQGMDYQYQILYGGSFEVKYSPAVLNTADVVSGEYLYQNSSVDVRDTLKEVAGYGIEIGHWSEKYLDVAVTCRAEQSGAYIEVPVFYYPGYTAVDKEGNTYEVSRSENNNKIRVNLPKGFDGTIKVSFREPFGWRVCEVVSLLAFFGLLFRKRMKSNVKQIRKESGTRWAGLVGGKHG